MGLLNKLKNVLSWRKKPDAVRQGKPHQLMPTTTTTKSQSLIRKPRDTQAVDVSAVSGIPKSLTTHESKSSLKRTVQILLPPKSAMQSGINNACHVELTFDRNQPKWENPLMGWISSRDAMQALKIKFGTVEEATRFAERQGWDVELLGDKETVEMERRRRAAIRPKSYADNFRHSEGKLKTIPTK